MVSWRNMKNRLVNEKIASHAEGEKVCREFARDYPEVRNVLLEIIEEAEDILSGVDMGLRPKPATWERYLAIRPQALDHVLEYDLSELRVWMFLRLRYTSLTANGRWQRSEKGKAWRREYDKKQRARANASITVDD